MMRTYQVVGRTGASYSRQETVSLADSTLTLFILRELEILALLLGDTLNMEKHACECTYMYVTCRHSYTCIVTCKAERIRDCLSTDSTFSPERWFDKGYLHSLSSLPPSPPNTYSHLGFHGSTHSLLQLDHAGRVLTSDEQETQLQPRGLGHHLADQLIV